MKHLRHALAAATVATFGAFAATGAQAASETFLVFTPLNYTFSVSAAGAYSFDTWAAALGYTASLYLGDTTAGSALTSASSSVFGTASFDQTLSTNTNYTFSLSSVLPSHTLASITLSGPGHIQSPVTLAPVPEPETYAMLLAGMGLVAAVARRRKASAARKTELIAL